MSDITYDEPADEIDALKSEIALAVTCMIEGIEMNDRFQQKILEQTERAQRAEDERDALMLMMGNLGYDVHMMRPDDDERWRDEQ